MLYLFLKIASVFLYLSTLYPVFFALAFESQNIQFWHILGYATKKTHGYTVFLYETKIILFKKKNNTLKT